jgi:hypothetical protein
MEYAMNNHFWLLCNFFAHGYFIDVNAILKFD